MLESKNSIPRDFSRFDKLSTEELREIIRQDSMLAEDEESDMDAILYIMEVLANREREENNVDIKASWQSFKENYYPYSSAEPLYQFDDETEQKKTAITALRRWRKPLTKIVSIAAAICLILLAGTVTAYALGYNLWGAIAVWTHDTFGFYSQEKIQNRKPFPNLTAALSAYEIQDQLVPTWLPNGFEDDLLKIIEAPKGVTFFSTCKADESDFVMQIVSYYPGQTSSWTYETIGEKVQTYQTNGITHYIMPISTQTRVLWVCNNNECSIRCSLQNDDIYRMIDSIYER